MIQLPHGTYDVIVADPPWGYYGDPDKDQAAGKHYELASDQDIKDMPVAQLAHDTSVLFLWATSPRLDLAIDAMRGWGFAYRGVAFVWVKTTLTGNIINGQGVRPSIVKPTTELVLAGSFKKAGRPLPLSDESIGQVVLAARGEHSQKPEQVQDRIEKMYPMQSKIELFARRQRPCWVCWGNEVVGVPPPCPFPPAGGAA